MNDARRKQLRELIGKLEEIAMNVEELKSQEQDYFDNMPESFQTGAKGEAAEQFIRELEDAQADVESAKDHIDEVVNA
jgi:flagellar biosynthesis chaperone FliJ